MSKIYSMTGYARSEGLVSDRSLTVEIKSVNHRYLDLKFHLPRELSAVEDRLGRLCREFFSRGRLEVWAGFAPGEAPVQVVWNRPLAAGMASALREMKSELGLGGEPELSLLASQKDVILVQESGPEVEAAWPELKAVFERAFALLHEMRAREGDALAADIKVRAEAVAKSLAALAQRAQATVPLIKERLSRRIKELLDQSAAIDESRLAQEAALLVDRADVTEELVRAKSHLDQLAAIFEEEGPKGRKLDFLIQELFREVNTAANKSQDVEAARLSVEIKTELEKIREQAQNLE